MVVKYKCFCVRHILPESYAELVGETTGGCPRTKSFERKMNI
jgi:hypothetical protein